MRGGEMADRYRFDEMAVMVNDRIDDPAEAGVERYVGLEHLDSDSLTIRRWGVPTDVTATKLLFRKGDIIFGRRRVYQRKLAVADFDGICSAHAMVLRSKPEVALPEFLPFFMQSDLFMERAKAISVGSLSPTINWKTLAREEFDLPPLEEQRRIISVLGTTSATMASLDHASDKANSVLRATLNAHFSPDFGTMECWPILQDFSLRISDGTHQPPPFIAAGIPFLLVSNITNGRINWNTEKYVSPEVFEELSRSWRPQMGDVLYSLVGSFGVPAMVDRDIPFSFQRHIGLIRTDPVKLRPKFLYWYLCSPSGLRQACLRAEGLAQKTITLGALRSFRILVTDLPRQDEIIDELDALQEAAAQLRRRADTARYIIRSITSAAFEGER
jgi:type I restriction enzyme, S subunit